MSPSLYPPTTPLRTHALAVGGGHRLHVEEHGFADGIPALVLHGGPGSGCSPLLRRFFDPARFRIICVDQRGAGASQPRGATENNTTADLLADLRLLREHLGIARCLVVGGSWGATLAVAHAADAPQAVSGLLLRSLFLARDDDVDWFFHGARAALPDEWAGFAAVAPADRRDDLLGFLTEVFGGGDPALQAVAAQAWSRWEQAMAASPSPAGVRPGRGLPAGHCAASTPALPEQGRDPEALIDRYRVQIHYLAHRCWLTAQPLLDRCSTLPPVPTLLLHGNADRVCRPSGAQLALARMPAASQARVRWIEGAGHDPAHPAMAAAMVEALDGFAADGHFGRSSGGAVDAGDRPAAAAAPCRTPP